MQNSLQNFFYPKSICLVGASSKEKSIGYELLKNILNYGYKGKIFPVNPNSAEVLGVKCFPDILSIKEKIDLAIIVVPKQFVENSVDELIQKNVKSIILITAGFKEIGKQGEEIEKRILQKVRSANANLVGPNCMGIISTLDETKLNATFVAEKPETGTTGFLSQSGALGAAVLNSLRETDIKFAHFVSVGNKADINENHILKFWEDDKNISTMTFYLESFVDGKDFISPFLHNEISKPVIVLKAGKTSSGMKAASSHTGALGSSDKVVDAVLNQFGILRVNNLNEMFNTAKGFENFPLPKGNKIAVITNAGGPAILAVDSLEKENLTLANLSDETKKKLKEIVHPEGSVENPVDLLPGGTAEIYKKVNEIVVQDENVDAVISIFVEPVMVQPFNVVESVFEIQTEKPIFQVDMPMPEFWDYYRKESKTKKPIFRNPEDPAEVISNMLFYKQRKLRLEKSKENRMHKNPDSKKYNFCEGYLDQKEVTQIAEDYGLPVIKSFLIKPDELISISDDQFPIVVKGISKEVIHKSEFNAVKLNIKNKEELFKIAEEMISEFRKFNFNLDEFLIQPYVKIKHEILLGGFRDASFGPMIMFGTGGKYVEVYNDTVLKSAHLSGGDVNEMINKTKIGKILKGVRGEEPADILLLRNAIKNAAQMILDNEEISEFDINPLVISESNQIYAVDVRIKRLKD